MSDKVKAPEPAKPISCETTGKLLARIDETGIYLWCKACRCEHHITLTAPSTSITHGLDVQRYTLTT